MRDRTGSWGVDTTHGAPFSRSSRVSPRRNRDGGRSRAVRRRAPPRVSDGAADRRLVRDRARRRHGLWQGAVARARRCHRDGPAPRNDADLVGARADRSHRRDRDQRSPAADDPRRLAGHAARDVGRAAVRSRQAAHELAELGDHGDRRGRDGHDRRPRTAAAPSRRRDRSGSCRDPEAARRSRCRGSRAVRSLGRDLDLDARQARRHRSGLPPRARWRMQDPRRRHPEHGREDGRRIG